MVEAAAGRSVAAVLPAVDASRASTISGMQAIRFRRSSLESAMVAPQLLFALVVLGVEIDACLGSSARRAFQIGSNSSSLAPSS